MAATAGCDIDPELMKIIHKGRVLRDEELLRALGIQNGDALHIAKGMAASTQKGYLDKASSDASDRLEIQLKAPGGIEVTLAVDSKDPVEELRKDAASRCGLKVEEIHLLHKGKILKDGLSFL